MSRVSAWLVVQTIVKSIIGVVLGVFGAMIFNGIFGTLYGITILGCFGGATIALIYFLWIKKAKRAALLIGITGFVIVFFWWHRHYQEKTQVATRYTQFYLALEQQNYETAYTYMAPFYQQSHTLEQFESDFDFIAEPYSLTTLEPKHAIYISKNKATLFPANNYYLRFYEGLVIHLVKINSEWYFTGGYSWVYD